VKVHGNLLTRFNGSTIEVRGLASTGQRGISFNGSTTYISRGQD